MTLAVRIVARLDVKAPNLVKMRRCEGLRVIGNPHDFACRCDADEILYMDIVASLYGRNSLRDLVERTTDDVFVPVTVGGGIRSVDDARALFQSGADKIALNTAAIERPALITEIARKFGAQAVVAQIDLMGREVWCDGYRQRTGRDAVEWASEVVDRGAGEILLTSIPHEGMGRGYALDIIEAISGVPVPVVAHGGMGHSGHMIEALRAGASAVCAHVTRLDDLGGIRSDLSGAGFPMRGIHHEPIRLAVSAG